jgi:hypothetical protein
MGDQKKFRSKQSVYRSVPGTWYLYLVPGNTIPDGNQRKQLVVGTSTFLLYIGVLYVDSRNSLEHACCASRSQHVPASRGTGYVSLIIDHRQTAVASCCKHTNAATCTVWSGPKKRELFRGSFSTVVI